MMFFDIPEMALDVHRIRAFAPIFIGLTEQLSVWKNIPWQFKIKVLCI